MLLPLHSLSQDSLRTVRATHPFAIKAGYMQGHVDGGYLLLGAEREVLRNSSIEVNLGFLPFNPKFIQNSPFFGLSATIEFKQFIAFHKHGLAGLFVGLHLGGNHNLRYYLNPRSKYSTATWGQAGGTFGFQWPLFPRWVLGAAVKGGYSNVVQYRYFSRTGKPLGTQVIGQPATFFVAAQLSFIL